MNSSTTLPCILFVNINGTGLGHLSRCLAYARRLRGRARPVFLSMASAVEVIHDIGFEADYFVSNTSSSSHDAAWNRELAVRLGLMFEELRPEVLVFDGTWPFHGLMSSCERWAGARKVWSNRGLHKPGAIKVTVEETEFDLVLEPGEIGAAVSVVRPDLPGRKVRVPPVTLFDDDELLGREEARAALGLEAEGRYALFSLGGGNVNDLGGVGRELAGAMQARGYTVVWARPPISTREISLPDDVMPLVLYPLARSMRAFDVFVGAGGYNTCCEVLQSQVPSLLIPNLDRIDDQALRSRMVAQHAPAVVSFCTTPGEREEAISSLLSLAVRRPEDGKLPALGGAKHAADEILALVGRAATP